MKKFLIYFMAMTTCLCAKAVTVTITTDEGFDNPAIISTMQQNLGVVLTEINNAYNAT